MSVFCAEFGRPGHSPVDQQDRSYVQNLRRVRFLRLVQRYGITAAKAQALSSRRPVTKMAASLDLKPNSCSSSKQATIRVITVWILNVNPAVIRPDEKTNVRGLTTVSGTHYVSCEIRYSAEGTSSPPRGHRGPSHCTLGGTCPSVKKPLPLFFGRNPEGSTSHKREATKEHT